MEHLPNEVLFHMMTFMDVASLQNFCQVFPALKETRHYAQCFLKAFLRGDMGATPNATCKTCFTTCETSQRLIDYPWVVPIMLHLLLIYPSSKVCLHCFFLHCLEHGLSLDIFPPSTVLHSCSLREKHNYLLTSLDYKTVSNHVFDMCLKTTNNPSPSPLHLNSPLHLAIYFDRKSIVKRLLDHGYRIDVQDYDGKYPHQYCCDEAMLHLLADAGKISRYFILYVMEAGPTDLPRFLYSNTNVGPCYEQWLVQHFFHDTCTPRHDDDDDDDY